MRVSLLVGLTVYPLAGEDGVDERVHSSAGGFELDSAAQVQEIQRVRAAHAEFVDRGNLLITVAFFTTRLFPTPAAAEIYCLDHDRTMPRSGTLVIQETGPEGVVMVTLLTEALLDPPNRRADGCTALLEYRATGSALQEI